MHQNNEYARSLANEAINRVVGSDPSDLEAQTELLREISRLLLIQANEIERTQLEKANEV